jgi:hypothetical protein
VTSRTARERHKVARTKPTALLGSTKRGLSRQNQEYLFGVVVPVVWRLCVSGRQYVESGAEILHGKTLADDRTAGGVAGMLILAFDIQLVVQNVVQHESSLLHAE